MSYDSANDKCTIINSSRRTGLNRIKNSLLCFIYMGDKLVQTHIKCKNTHKKSKWWNGRHVSFRS